MRERSPDVEARRGGGRSRAGRALCRPRSGCRRRRCGRARGARPPGRARGADAAPRRAAGAARRRADRPVPGGLLRAGGRVGPDARGLLRRRPGRGDLHARRGPVRRRRLPVDERLRPSELRRDRGEIPRADPQRRSRRPLEAPRGRAPGPALARRLDARRGCDGQRGPHARAVRAGAELGVDRAHLAAVGAAQAGRRGRHRLLRVRELGVAASRGGIGNRAAAARRGGRRPPHPLRGAGGSHPGQRVRLRRHRPQRGALRLRRGRLGRPRRAAARHPGGGRLGGAARLATSPASRPRRQDRLHLREVLLAGGRAERRGLRRDRD